MARICPACGHHNEDNFNYCVKCRQPLGAEVIVVSKEEVERLRKDQAMLSSLKQRGYAPSGTHLIENAEWSRLNAARTELDTIQRNGYAPSGYVLIDRMEYDKLRSNSRIKWLWVPVVVLVVILSFVLMSKALSDAPSSRSETSVETARYREGYPQEISGAYIVRMMNGRELDISKREEFITAQIGREGSDYAMWVYSNGITQKYTFSYYASEGKLISNELGEGMARIIDLTGETEITFEGWKLVI